LFNFAFKFHRLEEPPISACPSETEELTSGKEDEEEEAVDKGSPCHCPNYMNSLQNTVDKTGSQWPSSCNSIPSTSQDTPSRSNNNTDNSCENIDEIVNDHDNFGTDENEDSLDSESLDSSQYERLLHSGSGTRVRIPVEEDSIQCSQLPDLANLPVKRKSGLSPLTCNSLGDEEAGCSSVKKQCILAPDQTIEIFSGPVVETVRSPRRIRPSSIRGTAGD
jgi:hypothetical protein